MEINEVLTEFNKLGKFKIVHKLFWVIQLESVGFVDEARRLVDPYQAGGFVWDTPPDFQAKKITFRFTRT